MTQSTTIAITFTPRDIRAPLEYGDHQILQALFAAAQMVKARSGNLQTLGDPVVVLPAALYERASTIGWDGEGKQSILGRMLEIYGVACVADDADAPPDCDSCLAWEAIRRDLAALLPPADQQRSTLRMVQEIAAEVERLRIDVTHYREAAEGMTAQRVRELEERLMHEQNGHAHELDQAREELAIEQGKVAAMSEQMARGFAADIVASAEEAGQEAIEIATQAALAVLDVLAPPAEHEVHQIRVVLHGVDILRVLVSPNTEQAVLEEVEAEVSDKVGERLGPDSLVIVQREPGEPATGYLVRGGEAISASAPGLRWYWRHDAEPETEEAGPLDERAAVDATWEQFAADAAAEDEADE